MVFQGCCINILVHFASFKSTVIDLEICKDIVALFEDFQFYGQAINSVHQLRRFSLKAVPERVLLPEEFCIVETWQDFLSSHSIIM